MERLGLLERLEDRSVSTLAVGRAADALDNGVREKTALAVITAKWPNPDEEVLHALPAGAGSVARATTRAFVKICHWETAPIMDACLSLIEQDRINI
jgi:hypothetical protein